MQGQGRMFCMIASGCGRPLNGVRFSTEDPQTGGVFVGFPFEPATRKGAPSKKDARTNQQR